MRADADLVLAARSGEPDAFGELVARWTDRCWEIAWRILHDQQLAADVAQDTLLTAWQQLDRLQEAGSFGGWVSRIARNRALDRLAQERRAMPTDDGSALERVAAQQPGAVSQADPAVELERSERSQLVWAAAAALGPRDASLLDLHLRHGLEPGELAGELGISHNAAHQALFRLRRRLGVAVQAWLLWHQADPACAALRDAIEQAGLERFGAAAVELIEAHRATCLRCEQEAEAIVAPAGMFSAVPLVAMPAALRTQVIAGLRAEGVPVPASTSASPTGTQGSAAPSSQPDGTVVEEPTGTPAPPDVDPGQAPPVGSPIGGVVSSQEAPRAGAEVPATVVGKPGATDDEEVTGPVSSVLVLSALLALIVAAWLVVGWPALGGSAPAVSGGKVLVIEGSHSDDEQGPQPQLVAPLPAMPGGAENPAVVPALPLDPAPAASDQEVVVETSEPAAAPPTDDVAPGASGVDDTPGGDDGSAGQEPHDDGPAGGPGSDDPDDRQRDDDAAEDDRAPEDDGHEAETEPEPLPTVERFEVTAVDWSLCPEPTPSMFAYRIVLVSSDATSAVVTFLVPEGTSHDIAPNTGADGSLVCVPLAAEQVRLELVGPGGSVSVGATIT